MSDSPIRESPLAGCSGGLIGVADVGAISALVSVWLDVDVGFPLLRNLHLGSWHLSLLLLRFPRVALSQLEIIVATAASAFPHQNPR